MKFSTPTPILRMYDEAKARDFYVGFLGFKVDWEHRFGPDFPLYLQISLGDCVLHLSEHFGDVAPGSAVRIGVDDVEAYHAQIMSKGYKYMRPGLEDMPWGMREIKVLDPFFNRLSFYGQPRTPDADAHQ